MNPFRSIWRSLTLRSGDAWRSWFGGSNASGKPVTPDSALLLTAAWSCVRLISQTVSTLPLGLYERDEDNGRKEVSDHWLGQILTNSPNADQTPVEFFEGVLGCLVLRGNSFARKAGLRDNGSFAALETMFPDSVTIRRENGRKMFLWVDPDGKRVELPENEVWHVKGFGIGGDLGLSPLAYAKESFGGALAADESAHSIFANGLQNSGFLTVDQELKESQRKQISEIMDDFVGSKRAGKLMVLEAGMKYAPLSLRPDEAQLLETRRFNIEEVCRFFGVPPILVGHSPEGQTMWGSGVEQIMLGWLTLGLRPYLVRIEQSARKQLLPARERPKFYPEFAVEGLLRADSAARAQLYAAMSQNGLKTRNELRKLENDRPMPGGDVLTVQSNLVPLDKLGELAAGGGDAEKVRAAVRAWLQLDEEKRDAA